MASRISVWLFLRLFPNSPPPPPLRGPGNTVFVLLTAILLSLIEFRAWQPNLGTNQHVQTLWPWMNHRYVVPVLVLVTSTPLLRTPCYQGQNLHPRPNLSLAVCIISLFTT